jgi:hypothetical protein
MINVAKIITGLNGSVGFQQALNPAYPVLTAANTTSRSGLYATDNPHCKIEYIYDTTDYKDLSDADFNTELTSIQNNSIVDVANRVFNMPDFIDRQVLYKNANNKTTGLNLPSGFACYKIDVDSSKNIAFEIKRVILEFEGAGDVKILLFNSAVSTPIKQQLVTITGTQQIEKLDWVIDNTDNYYKGEFYIGYLTNDVALGTLKPFESEYNNSDIMSCITHLAIQRILFPGHATETLPDLESDDGLSDNIGLNLDITVYEDFTDLAIQNERLFYRAIQLQMTVKCLQKYLASLRSNRNERESERIIDRVLNLAVEDSNGNIKMSGLQPEVVTEIIRIQQEIKKLRDGYFTDRLTVSTLN